MQLKYSFEMMEIDDEVVAVPVGENARSLHGIVKLNTSGAEILSMLQDKKNEEEIIVELNNKYETSIEEIKLYVSDFVDSLKKAGLLE